MLKTIKENDVLQWYRPPPLTTVLYLPGHPGAGAYTYDRSPCGNNGTITGAVWKKLPSGLYYLDFDGSDDRVNCGTGVAGFTTEAFTIKFWMRQTWVNNRVLIGKGAQNADGWYLVTNISYGLQLITNQAAANQGTTSATNATPDDTWLQVIITRSGASVRIYVDNVDKVASAASHTNPVYNAARPLVIGAYDATGSLPANADIALEEIISGTAWSAAQRGQSYQRERHLLGV